MDKVAEGIVLRNVCIVKGHFARVVVVFEGHNQICEISPILEFPSHFDSFVFHKLLIFTEDGAIEHLKFTTGLGFRERKATSELTDEHLVCERPVDEVSWNVVFCDDC